jgi:hypothetical protein
MTSAATHIPTVLWDVLVVDELTMLRDIIRRLYVNQASGYYAICEENINNERVNLAARVAVLLSSLSMKFAAAARPLLDVALTYYWLIGKEKRPCGGGNYTVSMLPPPMAAGPSMGHVLAIYREFERRTRRLYGGGGRLLQNTSGEGGIDMWPSMESSIATAIDRHACQNAVRLNDRGNASIRFTNSIRDFSDKGRTLDALEETVRAFDKGLDTIAVNTHHHLHFDNSKRTSTRFFRFTCRYGASMQLFQQFLQSAVATGCVIFRIVGLRWAWSLSGGGCRYLRYPIGQENYHTKSLTITNLRNFGYRFNDQMPPSYNFYRVESLEFAPAVVTNLESEIDRIVTEKQRIDDASGNGNIARMSYAEHKIISDYKKIPRMRAQIEKINAKLHECMPVYQRYLDKTARDLKI